jgi:tetrahydromethanopterin S-methyltransferase subunit B
MIATGIIEERINELQAQKRELIDSVTQSGGGIHHGVQRNGIDEAVGYLKTILYGRMNKMLYFFLRKDYAFPK